ncbi:hypothetical protein COLO4_37035 [Corchorus olitorius]|uniref:Uncharacterized protein n=1 Tax=Corchorus olitorius TaxID=93759 RepID=A0A1R3G3Q5_9ROSI|nr:hypothetical protein COLO4_37035 [Corchorus olitorius]
MPKPNHALGCVDGAAFGAAAGVAAIATATLYPPPNPTSHYAGSPFPCICSLQSASLGYLFLRLI